MNSNKTQISDANVSEFIAAIEHPQRRADAEIICAIMSKLSGCQPRLWGSSIIGFDHYDYTYASGRSGRWPRIGFSAQKTKLSLYIMAGFESRREQLSALGKHKIGKSCLYINKLADVDMDVLNELIVAALAEMSERYGPSLP
jgi:hypothetical protein